MFRKRETGVNDGNDGRGHRECGRSQPARPRRSPKGARAQPAGPPADDPEGAPPSRGHRGPARVRARGRPSSRVRGCSITHLSVLAGCVRVGVAAGQEPRPGAVGALTRQRSRSKTRSGSDSARARDAKRRRAVPRGHIENVSRPGWLAGERGGRSSRRGQAGDETGEKWADEFGADKKKEAKAAMVGRCCRCGWAIELAGCWLGTREVENFDRRQRVGTGSDAWYASAALPSFMWKDADSRISLFGAVSTLRETT